MRKRRISALILTIALCGTLMAGCGGKEETKQASGNTEAKKVEAQEKDEEVTVKAGQEITISLTNDTDWIFNEIYMTASSSDDWGADLMGSTSILKSGGTHDISFAATNNGMYNLLIIDEDGDTWFFERVPLDGGSSLSVIQDDGEAVAVAIAADGEEVYLTGMLGSDSDYDFEEYDDEEGLAWEEFGLYNNTNFSFDEAYFVEAGATEQEAYDADDLYNHLESIGAIGSEAGADIGVTGYAYHDVYLADEEGDGWYFSNVDLELASEVYIQMDEDGTPHLVIDYENGSSADFTGEYV